MAEPIPRVTLETAAALRRSSALLARRFRRLRADHGVSAAKLSVLSHLYRKGEPVTAVDLARLEGLQPQSLTRIIADLDEKGLIVRRPDEADRRQVRIAISEAGRDLLMQDARAQTIWLAQAIEAELTGTEQALLHMAVGLLDRLNGFEGVAGADGKTGDEPASP